MCAVQTTVTDLTSTDTASAEPASTYHYIGEDCDSELLEFLRMGLPEAFGALMNRYNHRLKRLAFGITGSREDAEDAVQNTFIQVFRHIGEFRGGCKFTTWLNRIAINESLQVLRRRRDRGISIDELIGNEDVDLHRELRAPCETPEQNLLRRELRERLLGMLKTLREPSRQVAELYYVHGLSSPEIAGAMGISAAAAKSRVMRAKPELTRDGAQRLYPPRRHTKDRKNTNGLEL